MIQLTHIMIQAGSTLNELLTSSTRAKLLTLLFTHPTEEFYLRELHRRSGQSLHAVQHEVARLERLGLVVVNQRGRQKFFRANDQHPLFADLKRIVYKTAALGDVLRDALRGAKGIEAAFIYGSVARGRERPTSDIDLMVIGDADSDELHRALRQAEEALDREVTLNRMSKAEWSERRARKDSFVTEVLKSEKIFLVGSDPNLRRS